MKKSVRIVLIGIGGYGNLYLEKLLNEGEQLNAQVVGAVDPVPERSSNYQRIIDQQIPIFSSIEEFYEEHEADLAILSTPIHLHVFQSCYALSHGSHVLCEKPMCASLQEAEQLIKARNESGKFVAIGFNWSFSPSVHQLKADIMAGTFGKPKRFKTIINWPRNKDYFNRNSWAGRLYSDQGAPIFDSVANNATSHYMHHMFYLLGSQLDESAALKETTAELYRANPIENFDTCAVRFITEADTEVLYYSTHAVNERYGPHFYYEFEDAVIYRIEEERDNQVIARFHDGTEKVYPDPEKDHLHKLEFCIQAILNNEKDIPCGPETALTHVQAIQAIHQSVPEINSFPNDLIRVDKDTEVTWVEGLGETLKQCYDQWDLPSNMGVSWAKKGKTIQLHHLLK